MTYPIIIIYLLVLTFIHIMKKRNGKESRFPFTSVFLGVIFGYLQQATAIGSIIGIPDLGLYLSLTFWDSPFCRSCLGKASRNAKQMRDSAAAYPV